MLVLFFFFFFYVPHEGTETSRTERAGIRILHALGLAYSGNEDIFFSVISLTFLLVLSTVIIFVSALKEKTDTVSYDLDL